MIETIFRRTILVGVFLVLLTPFVVTNSTFFPFVVGKAVFFRTIVGLMLGAWGILAISVPAYRPRWSPVMISAAIFLGVVCIVDILGTNVARSFWSNFERMEGFVTIFHVIAYLFVLGSVMRSERLWNWFWNASVGVGVLLSFMAFGEASKVLQGELIRVDATLGNPTYLAVYLLVNVFIALFMAYRARTDRFRLVGYIVAIIIQIGGLYYTGTRGAFLGVAAGIGIAALLVLIRGKAHPGMRRIAGAIIALTLVGAGGFFMWRDTAFFQENPTLARIANISFTDVTVQSRLTLWTSIGWNAFLERPLLGWGQDNFIVVFGKYYDPLMYKQEPWFDRAHNVLMDWAIAGGVFALFAYLALFVTTLIMLWRSSLSVPEKSVLTGLLGAYMVNNLFVFDNLTSYISFVGVLAYVHARESYGQEDRALHHQASSVNTPVLVGGIILAAALVWFSAVRPMARAQTLLEGLRTEYSQHDPVATLAYYEKALAYGNSTGLEETREQLSQSATRLLDDASVDPAGSNVLVQRAIAELTTSAAEEPDNTRRLAFLAGMLKESGDLKDALTVYDQALAINPTRQNFLYAVAQIYLAQGDFDKVIETMHRAYEAEEENDTAFGYYAAALMLAGRDKEGEALLMDRFGTTTVDNDLVFNAYQKAGRNDKIAEILEFRLQKMAPEDDAATRVSLALTYLDLGRRNEAIDQIQQAALLRPDFAAQAEQMIAAIKAGRNIIINK